MCERRVGWQLSLPQPLQSLTAFCLPEGFREPTAPGSSVFGGSGSLEQAAKTLSFAGTSILVSLVLSRRILEMMCSVSFLNPISGLPSCYRQEYLSHSAFTCWTLPLPPGKCYINYGCIWLFSGVGICILTWITPCPALGCQFCLMLHLCPPTQNINLAQNQS